MTGALIDRPLLQAIARAGENDPRWLRRPKTPGGLGAILFPRAVVLVSVSMPVSVEGETHRDAFRLFLSDKYAAHEAGEGLAALRAALDRVRNIPIDGHAIVLGGHWNHFHWLIDFLPRIGLLADRAGLPGARIVIHAETTDVQRDSLEWAMAALKIDDVPVERTPPGIDLAAVAGLIAPLRVGRETAVAFWRAVMARSGIVAGGSRRLLIRRGAVGRRRLIGEELLAEHLATLGFEAIDPGSMSFAAQVEAFSQARVVVGTHGAALANMVFAPADATLVELRARDVMDGYRDLAHAGGQRHVPVLVPHAEAKGPVAAHRDLMLGEAALGQLVAMIARLD